MKKELRQTVLNRMKKLSGKEKKKDSDYCRSGNCGSSGFGICGIFDKRFYDAGKFGKSYQSNRACLYYR